MTELERIHLSIICFFTSILSILHHLHIYLYLFYLSIYHVPVFISILSIHVPSICLFMSVLPVYRLSIICLSVTYLLALFPGEPQLIQQLRIFQVHKLS